MAHTSGSSPVQEDNVPVTPVFDILYENAEMVVINKPANVPMDVSRASCDDAKEEVALSHTVEAWATAHLKARGLFDEDHAALERAQKRRKQVKFVHQLDAATSGVLCLAFSKSMAARLAHCFEAGTAEKTYIALVAGHMPDTRWSAVKDSEPRAHKADCQRAVLEAFVRTLPVLSHMATDASTPLSASSPPPGMSAKSSSELPISVTLIETATSATEGGASSDNTAHTTLCLRLPVGYDPHDAAHLRMAVGPLASPPPTDTLVPESDATAVEWRRRDRFRSAETCITVLARGYMWHAPTSAWWPVTKLRLAPHTGRRHQLRVHCHALGHPIVGDPLYATQPLFHAPGAAPSTNVDETTPFPTEGWPRMYLHAQRLRLPCSVQPTETEAERVALKKKRRRETLGLESGVTMEEAQEISVFETLIPFAISTQPGGPSA